MKVSITFCLEKVHRIQRKGNKSGDGRKIIKSAFKIRLCKQSDLKLYEDLGLDSLKRTELICEIENEFGFEFELDELNPEKMGTVGKIFNIVKKQTCKMMV